MTATPLDWATRARAALRELAATGDPFCADDLLGKVGHPDEGHAPNAHNNAIGSIFGQASHDGEIRAVGVRQSTQPHRKGGMVRLWVGVRDA